MEWWIAQAMDAAQEWAPDLTDEQALDLAANLHHGCRDDEPAFAVGRFFAVMVPLGWTAGTVSSCGPAR